MPEPVCLTWEQFAPPYKEVRGILFPKSFGRRLQRIKPIGPGEPLSGDDNRYRIHEGRFAASDDTNEKRVYENEFALVATFEGSAIGIISGVSLWVHEEHRRNANNVDLAAELWVAHSVRRGLRLFDQHYARAGQPVPMVRSTIKVGMRAYRLCIERGFVVLPAGYEIPTLD